MYTEQEQALIDEIWMTEHTNMMENGGCPVCYQDDESIFTHGHKEGCEWNSLEATNAALLEALQYIDVELECRFWDDEDLIVRLKAFTTEAIRKATE